MSSTICFLLIAFFVFLAAFFVAAERAFLKMPRSRLEELEAKGRKTARIALFVSAKPDLFFATTTFGLTSCVLIIGGIGACGLTPFVCSFFGPLLEKDPVLVHCAGIAVSFLTTALFCLIFAEALPRAIADEKTEGVLLLTIRPLLLIGHLLRPVTYPVGKAVRIILRTFGLKPARNDDSSRTEEEIKLIASASQRGGIIDKTESEIIKNAVDFSDKIAREIMVPRQDMDCLYLDSSFDENFDEVKNTNHTRYPVCNEDKDNVVGMVHLRDMLMNNGERDITKMLREVLFVPESMSVSEILHLMKKRRIHMAIVVDEYGGTSGLISMEDVLEELVGDIQDEHDTTDEEYERKMPDGSYEFLGMALLDEAMEFMDLLPIKDHDEDTIGGYVFAMLARKPKTGDVVNCPQCTLEILETDGFRVKKVKAVVKPKALVDDDDENEDGDSGENDD